MYAQNLSAFGVPGPEGYKAIDVRDISLDHIDVGPRQRPLDRKKVEELAKSIMEHGQKQPIAVRYKKGAIGGVELIFGHHRFEAMKLIDKEGLDKRCSIWATIYPEDYPDIRIQLDEIVENLHRNDLTPAEQAVHQEKYASILKTLKKVRSAHENKITNLRKQNGQGVHMRPLGESIKPTVAQKLESDLGVNPSTVTRRHVQAVTLAKREGYAGETSLEKMTSTEHDTVVELARKAAAKKKEKAEVTGKPERVTDRLRERKATVIAFEVDVTELPDAMVRWCRRRIKDTEKTLTLEVLKATHQALGDLIQEIENR